MSYWVEQPTEAELTQARNRSNKTHSSDVYAVFRFRGVHSHMFGFPNEEAFHGHPLASRGFHSFAIFEVKNSSWIAQMKRMNSVHPAHTEEMFSTLRHFIFGFHDSTFEILARNIELELMNDHWKHRHVFTRMQELLNHDE